MRSIGSRADPAIAVATRRRPRRTASRRVRRSTRPRRDARARRFVTDPGAIAPATPAFPTARATPRATAPALASLESDSPSLAAPRARRTSEPRKPPRRIAPSAPDDTCATAPTGRTPTPNVSGSLQSRRALVHMYVGKHTLKASFEHHRVSRGNRPREPRHDDAQEHERTPRTPPRRAG